jgi:acetyl/propionyl-CoA carboxylase alpha subunit
MAKLFEKILIANRGEIACRVIASCRELGVATVAVHSQADQQALHVQQADEAVPIGPAPSAESYLVIDKIIDACKRTGAQAVHPGFGFLSENSAFVEALDRAGIVFIGPPTGAIAAMGDKITSKKLAAEAGVSTVPGYMGAIADADEGAFARHRTRRARASATSACSSRSSSRSRAISRYKCWPMRMATPSIWASASVPSSGATRR